MNWSLTGVLEGLGLLDIDTSPGVLDVGPDIVPVLDMGELSLNYKPALNQRLFGRVTLGPTVGAFGGMSIGANFGWWLVTCASLAGVGLGVGVSVDSTFFDSVAGFPLNWNKLGTDSGQVRAQQQSLELRTNVGAYPAAPPNAPSQIVVTNAVHVPGFFPLWVPAGAYLNLVCVTANSNVDFSLAVQIPANVVIGGW